MGLTHRTLLVVVALLGLGSVAGIVLLWPPGDRVDEQVEAESEAQQDLIDATIVEVEPVGEVNDPGLAPGARSVVIIAEIAETGELEVFPMVDDHGDLYEAGDRVRLQRYEPVEEGGEPTYAIADFQRGPALAALTAMFVLAVLAFGRFQGARALLGLGITFALIIGFIVPAVLAGRSPLLVALTGSVAIMIVTLYLSHGFTRKTTAAVVGTAGALAVTVALGSLFVEVASLTGMADEEARLASVQVGGISLQGLLLAGIIIGALGVLDDVTMSQSSTVFALSRAHPAASLRHLVSEALDVGRDHVAATVNTLVLAYAGASLPLLILFVTGPVGVEEVITGELVAVEAVRTLVGSLGLIAAVPLTTVLAAALVRGDPGAAAEAGGAGEAGDAGDADHGDHADHAGHADHGDHADHADHAGHAGHADRAGHAGERGAAPTDPGAADRPVGVADDPVGAALASATPEETRPTDQEPADTGASGSDEATGTDADEEWERRLREAYGLDDEPRGNG